MEDFLTGPLSRYTYGWIALFVFACVGVYWIWMAVNGERLDKFIVLGLSLRAQVVCGFLCMVPLVLYSFGMLLI
jgi:hypothetical protein